MTSGFVRFGAPKTVVCNLGTSGALATHTPGAAYSGTFSVTNRVGDVTAELVSATPALPAGWTLAVNQATGVVTLAWPAAAPVSAPPLPNLDFETGTASWLLGNGWDVTAVGLVDSGTQSAKYNGPGQATIRHAQAVPVTPGTSITASARISKGANRQDFAGGAVVLEWLTAAGAPLSFSVGNVVNTGSSAFQTSTVTATAPAGAGLVRLGISGTRDIKGRAIDRVYADTVTWNHAYTLAGASATDYAVAIRVRDGRGCQATLSQTITAQSLNVISLLNLNGTNGSTTFTDATGRSWTRTGTAAISTAQSQYGGASLSIPSTTSGIQTLGGLATVPNGTDYCVEFWVRDGNLSTGDNKMLCILGGNQFGSTANSLRIDMTENSRNIRVEHFDGTTARSMGATVSLLTNTSFSHVAVTMQNTGGNSISRIFIDGVQRASVNNNFASGGITFGTGGIYLGGIGRSSLIGGFIDDFRVVIGSPVYTANFTPPGQHTL